MIATSETCICSPWPRASSHIPRPRPASTTSQAASRRRLGKSGKRPGTRRHPAEAEALPSFSGGFQYQKRPEISQDHQGACCDLVQAVTLSFKRESHAARTQEELEQLNRGTGTGGANELLAEVAAWTFHTEAQCVCLFQHPTKRLSNQAARTRHSHAFTCQTSRNLVPTVPIATSLPSFGLLHGYRTLQMHRRLIGPEVGDR